MKNCLAAFPFEEASLDYLTGIIRYFTEIQDRPFRLFQCNPHEDFTARTVHSPKYDGFIVPIPGSPSTARALAASDKPTVLVNVNDTLLSARTRNVTSVWIDNFDMGRIGAEHFLSHGGYASFGFIQLPSTDGDLFYSRERESAFRNTLKKKGFVSSCFPDATGDYSDAALTRWLKDLPKPAAIMTVCDAVAVRALNCCARAHLSVPGQVSLLGIDDVRPLTTGKGRSLSSVRPDFAKVGYIAAKELVRMLSGKPSDKPKEIVIAASELIVRNSTRPPVSNSNLVRNALTYIEQNAGRDVNPDEIARHLGRSRRLLDMRLREICGKTLSAAILEARMRQVSVALQDPAKTVKQIAKDLHFRSTSHLCTLFRRHFGQRIGECRKQGALKES